MWFYLMHILIFLFRNVEVRFPGDYDIFKTIFNKNIIKFVY